MSRSHEYCRGDDEENEIVKQRKFSDLKLTDKKKNAPSVKEKIFYNTGGRKPYVKKPVVTQQRIDQILDKINQKGFSSLSEDEKSILKKARETDF